MRWQNTTRQMTSILSKSQTVTASGFGFTTDEYVDFLNGPLNGKDVISYGAGMFEYTEPAIYTTISSLFDGYFENTPENRVKYTKEHIDVLENTILNCSSATTEDADINIILIEEMPAYFSDQKSLDQVIKIAQNRAQKVLDERG